MPLENRQHLVDIVFKTAETLTSEMKICAIKKAAGAEFKAPPRYKQIMVALHQSQIAIFEGNDDALAMYAQELKEQLQRAKRPIPA